MAKSRLSTSRDQVVGDELPDKADVDTEKVGDLVYWMQLGNRLLGRVLDGLVGEQANLDSKSVERFRVVELGLNDVEGHVPRFLEVQNDLKAAHILLGILSVSLGGAMRRNQPFIFQEANLGVRKVWIRSTKQVDDLADAQVAALGQDHSPVSMRSGLLS